MMKFLLKRLALPVAMALCGLSSFAAAGSGVTFLLQNGAKASFAFSAKPTISVDTDGITVTAVGHSEVSYLFSEVQRFYFEDDVLDAVHQAKADAANAPVFSYANGVVVVSGLVADEQVAVYAVNGHKVNGAKADAAGCARVDISQVSSGVYVVSTGGGVSFKLLKK